MNSIKSTKGVEILSRFNFEAGRKLLNNEIKGRVCQFSN